MPHNWSKEDDIIAFYLYRYGPESLMMTLESISQKLGMSASSLRMRVGNFKALDGDGGLQNWAKQSEKVYQDYKKHFRGELLNIVNQILNGK